MFGVGRKEFRLLFADAAGGVGGMMTENGIPSEEGSQERLEKLGIGKDLSGHVACVGESPGRGLELQFAGVGADRAWHERVSGESYVAQLTISS